MGRRGLPLEELIGERKAALVRGLLAGVVRRDAEPAPGLVALLDAQMVSLANELRAPSESERADNLRAAVMPLLAAIVL